MADPAPEKRSQKAVLLVGPGPHARETGAVLAALSALDSAGARGAEPLVESTLADLEELLTQRSLEGLLILEVGHVPGEDIGFVRRFLERHAAWRLVVVGENEQDPHARTLLALARARWLAWPPDLDGLRALLPAGGSGRPENARGERSRAPRGAPRPRVNGGVDLGALLEELLAGAAVRTDGAARYQFAAGSVCRVPGEREVLLEGLHGLIELARVCAGGDGLVRTTLAGNGEAALVQLEFPRAALPVKGLGGLLDASADRAPTDQEEPALAEALSAARRGAELLREAGGRVELGGAEAGRVRCEVRFAARAAVPAAARTGKPEDPFA